MIDVNRIVIVGAGQAGFQAAVSVADAGYAGSIVWLGEEPSAPYQRPPLSKAYLAGEATAEALFLRPENFYAERGIILRTGTTVIDLNRASRRIALTSGEQLSYDHLILATGARVRQLLVPGADLAGVMQLRTQADAVNIRRRLQAVNRIVVVGAGFIGLEFAATAARSSAVTVIEAAATVLSRAVSEPIADFIRTSHEVAGIHFVFNASVARILGSGGHVTTVETTDGRTLPADLVLVGIGVVPNADIAVRAGLAVKDGIVVDHNLLTSDPAVSAIGDCAVFPNAFADMTPTRIESVQNAVDQARCVAARLAGRPAPYVAVPWFWSDQGKLKLQIAGLSRPHDLVVPRGNQPSGAFSVFCYRQGRLVGVESLNCPADHMLARRVINERLPLAPDEAADLAVDLRALVKGGQGRATPLAYRDADAFAQTL